MESAPPFDIKKRALGRSRTTAGTKNLFIRGVDDTTTVAFDLLCGSKSPSVMLARIVREAFERRAETNESAKALFERLYGGAA